MKNKRIYTKLIPSFASGIGQTYRLPLTVLACILTWTTKSDAQSQVGSAYIRYFVDTGELRMNPGNSVAENGSYSDPSQTPLSWGINSFGIEFDPAIMTISTNVSDYYFPSGTWPLFFPQTGANPGNALGSAFQTWSGPNILAASGGPSNDSLNANNLVIGSPWVTQTGGSTGSTGSAIPGTTAVYASDIAGYEGTPEFSFGFIGQAGVLTPEQALAALGATEQGGFATGNRVYSMQNVVGTQFFKVYTETSAIPEPSAVMLASLMGGLLVLRRKRV